MQKLAAALLIAFCGQVALGLRGSYSLRTPRSTAATHLHVGPDHLIDCAQSPQLAELFGGVKSDVCLQTQMGLFSGVGGLFDQAITIGFLVMSYFFFKRSANGVIDWIDTEVDEEDILYNSSGAAADTNCPKCAGTGRFSWDDDDPSSASSCKLCDGTGKVDGSSMVMRRAARLRLPGATSEDDKDL